MNIFGRRIAYPGTALVIYFLIGALLAKYGIVEGSLLLFALFAGVIIYKVVTASA